MKQSHLFLSRFPSYWVQTTGFSADISSHLWVCDSSYHRVTGLCDSKRAELSTTTGPHRWKCVRVPDHGWSTPQAPLLLSVVCRLQRAARHQTGMTQAAPFSSPAASPSEPWYHEGRSAASVSHRSLTPTHLVMKVVDDDGFWNLFSLLSASLCVCGFKLD